MRLSRFVFTRFSYAGVGVNHVPVAGLHPHLAHELREGVLLGGRRSVGRLDVSRLNAGLALGGLALGALVVGGLVVGRLVDGRFQVGCLDVCLLGLD